MNLLRITVEDFLESAPYFPCLLLVHPEIKRLRAAADELGESYSWPQLSIGHELSGVLLMVEPERRPRKAVRWVEWKLGGLRPGPLLCVDVDLLFEPSLQVEPLTLFRSNSRATRLVVMWPGTYRNGVLAYAVPEHADYRTWNNPQVAIAVLN